MYFTYGRGNSKVIMKKSLYSLLFLVLHCCAAVAEQKGGREANLTYTFSQGYGQVEVGGVYAGAEFHGSRPLPSRISFFYPVANSIDLSNDYWKRGESRPLVVGVRFGAGPKRWLGKEPWRYEVGPHRVVFYREELDVAYSMTYGFFKNEPGLVFRVAVRNTSNRAIKAEVYTHLKTTLRTCQTYTRVDSARTGYDDSLRALRVDFDEPGLQRAGILVQNVGYQAMGFTTDASALGIADTGRSSWIQAPPEFNGRLFSRGMKGDVVAAFIYSKEIGAGDSLVIAQVIASAPRGEIRDLAGRLSRTWESEVSAFDAFILRKVAEGAGVETGEADIDNSARWAAGILAANRHFIDGAIVPMPCPAEYNFFFTHDVLLTDLGAANFDLPRVKDDLCYIAAHSKDNIIPHAYYWKDDGFKTEWCTPDNWNHLWFVLCTARYVRHSLDTATARALYPLVSKSLKEILTQCREDNLMYAFRPDWWDIGHVEGARSYITILTIRALREFLYLSSALGIRDARLMRYEKLADAMQEALRSRLWDNPSGYLTNYNGAVRDHHFYMGSLLAGAFDLLSRDETNRLVATATRQLADARIGVRTVAPADFHLDSVRAFFKFSGNEAGDPYLYANGGVWPHNNAWYVLALCSVGRYGDALGFFRKTMTVEGVMRSPMGQPAMFEYRFSDSSSAEFGRIDKPSFLWAGGFYLSTLYHLLGIRDNEWNLSFAPRPCIPFDSARYFLSYGKRKHVEVHGKDDAIAGISVDGMIIPSLVLPLQAMEASQVEVLRGWKPYPILESVNAILYDIRLENKRRVITLEVSSFEGHATLARLVAAGKTPRVFVDGKIAHTMTTNTIGGDQNEIVVRFPGSHLRQRVEISY